MEEDFLLPTFKLVPYLLYPFPHWWTLRLLLCLGCCKQCHNEHWAAWILSDHEFFYIWIFFSNLGPTLCLEKCHLSEKQRLRVQPAEPPPTLAILAVGGGVLAVRGCSQETRILGHCGGFLPAWSMTTRGFGGNTVPWIFPGLGWAGGFCFSAWSENVRHLVLISCFLHDGFVTKSSPTFETPWTVVC